MSKKVWKQVGVKSADKLAGVLNGLGLGKDDCQVFAKPNGRLVVLYMGAEEAPKAAKPEVKVEAKADEPAKEEAPKAAKPAKAGK